MKLLTFIRPIKRKLKATFISVSSCYKLILFWLLCWPFQPFPIRQLCLLIFLPLSRRHQIISERFFPRNFRLTFVYIRHRLSVLFYFLRRKMSIKAENIKFLPPKMKRQNVNKRSLFLSRMASSTSDILLFQGSVYPSWFLHVKGFNPTKPANIYQARFVLEAKKTLKRENFFRFTFLSTWDLSSFPTHSWNSCCRPPKSNSKLLHYISPFTFFTPIAEHFWRFKNLLLTLWNRKAKTLFA